jgi:predicted phage-related endonuclease
MIWGTENEPIARTEYEIATGLEVKPIGLAMHEGIKWFSASTDGLVAQDGMLEVKCLDSINHLDILINQEIPEKYHWQMLDGVRSSSVSLRSGRDSREAESVKEGN